MSEVTVMQTEKEDMRNHTKATTLMILAIPTILTLGIGGTIVIGLLNAWVAQKMYIWFLLPLHAPRLNLWHVWGIVLLISLLTPSSSANQDEKDKAKLIGKMAGFIIAPFVILLMGYIIKGHIGY